MDGDDLERVSGPLPSEFDLESSVKATVSSLGFLINLDKLLLLSLLRRGFGEFSEATFSFLNLDRLTLLSLTIGLFGSLLDSSIRPPRVELF